MQASVLVMLMTIVRLRHLRLRPRCDALLVRRLISWIGCLTKVYHEISMLVTVQGRKRGGSDPKPGPVRTRTRTTRSLFLSTGSADSGRSGFGSYSFILLTGAGRVRTVLLTGAGRVRVL